MRKFVLVLLLVAFMLTLVGCYEPNGYRGYIYVLRLCDGSRVEVRDMYCIMDEEGAVFCSNFDSGERDFGCVLEMTREQ